MDRLCGRCASAPSTATSLYCPTCLDLIAPKPEWTAIDRLTRALNIATESFKLIRVSMGNPGASLWTYLDASNEAARALAAIKKEVGP